ncbi:hypothetical protein DTO164E3_2401 [Paecilomyces variotii]|nr:hypothetical protein DTO164E3_2401 [Paecilomyces variotii]KAJ9206820.1 hypothetical protein DTO032I3_1408 [Paecilomyces variotii]KAJ9274401.1 hypothetical protein DTO021D3_8765 [Paecilomyces variotii]KAJ9290350.1 hypothetical protein DTO021C3_1974 [Paecilomyces variotii]KAJ9346592.1 hypothetical protein DTO027B6_846 [Paecilomyces variotii]
MLPARAEASCRRSVHLAAVYDPRTLNKQKRHYEIISDASHNHISPARIGIPVCRPHQRPKDCSTKRRH